jgi:choline dehydrogenase-like flavoprotein
VEPNGQSHVSSLFVLPFPRLLLTLHRYDAIKVMAGDQAENIEYWHDGEVQRHSQSPTHDVIERTPGSWKADRPTTGMIRVPGIVHETATLYMSDDLEKDPHASVDKHYRPRNCENVYVTGGAIFPSSGSWNRKSLMSSIAASAEF